MVVLLMALVAQSAIGQKGESGELKGLCDVVYQEDWQKADKKIQKLINHWVDLDYSLGYPNYGLAIDSLVEMFKQLPCVEEAYADYCAMKLMIWPGYSVIGVKYVVEGNSKEVCYTIQQGKIRSINVLGLMRFPRQGKEELVFKGSNLCDGFIEEQRKLCEEANLKGL